MNDDVEKTITFGCFFNGKFDIIDGKLLYLGGDYRILEGKASEVFSLLRSKLPICMYGQRTWYKAPFEEVGDRKLLDAGGRNLKKMCDTVIWTNAIDIFIELESESIVGIEDHMREREVPLLNENVRNRTGEEDHTRESDEPDRAEHHFVEEDRVERNVADFVDDEVDEYATPVASDDEEAGSDDEGYLTYMKGSGELKLRQAFDSLDAFKQAMVDYVLKYKRNVKYTRWDKDKSELRCASVPGEDEEECLWRIYCSYEETVQKWMVKVFVPDHSCAKTQYSKLLTQEVIARLFVDDVRDNPLLRPKDILNSIHTRWELIPTIEQCRKAKKRALEMIQKEHDAQYSMLRNYRIELLRSNPDSTVELETVQDELGRDTFLRMYICFAALKKTWCSFCRPIFGLDGCFLKCATKGQLLAAVGRDANNQMFPIAWATVDVETEDNWRWFIEKLQYDLNLCAGDGFTLISDRQKGLMNAVQSLLPNVEHRMCARHIYANLKKAHPSRADMKGLFWKVAKSYNMPQYNRRVERVKAYDLEVYNSMMMKNPRNCSLAYFTPTVKCDDVSNNISESFNNAIDPARKMPLVEMLETIRRRAMLRIEARKVKSNKHRGKFSLKAMERVDEEQKKILHCQIFPCGYEVFEVKEKNMAFKVKMMERTCDCRKWDMSGLPCRHALKVISVKKRNPEDYIADCYLTSRWRNQYETPIEGVRGFNFWGQHDEEETELIFPAPTEPEASTGGRKKIPKRIKGRNESPTKKKAKQKEADPTKVSRAKRVIHCGRCGLTGHNTRKCKNIGVAIQRPPKKKNVGGGSDLGDGQVSQSQPTQSQVFD